MGKMKEVFMAIREGEIEEMRTLVKEAEAKGQETAVYRGVRYSLTYLKYRVQYSDTFLKQLIYDNSSY